MTHVYLFVNDLYKTQVGRMIITNFPVMDKDKLTEWVNFEARIDGHSGNWKLDRIETGFINE